MLSDVKHQYQYQYLYVSPENTFAPQQQMEKLNIWWSGILSVEKHLDYT